MLVVQDQQPVNGEFVDRWSEGAADRLRHAAVGV
jgi:hypothetical protein